MNADISETIKDRELGLQIKDSVALYAAQVFSQICHAHKPHKAYGYNQDLKCDRILTKYHMYHFLF